MRSLQQRGQDSSFDEGVGLESLGGQAWLKSTYVEGLVALGPFAPPLPSLQGAAEVGAPLPVAPAGPST